MRGGLALSPSEEQQQSRRKNYLLSTKSSSGGNGQLPGAIAIASMNVSTRGGRRVSASAVPSSSLGVGAGVTGPGSIPMMSNPNYNPNNTHTNTTNNRNTNGLAGSLTPSAIFPSDVADRLDDNNNGNNNKRPPPPTRRRSNDSNHAFRPNLASFEKHNGNNRRGSADGGGKNIALQNSTNTNHNNNTSLNKDNNKDKHDNNKMPKFKSQVRKYQIRDPTDPTAVGHLVTHLIPSRKGNDNGQGAAAAAAASAAAALAAKKEDTAVDTPTGTEEKAVNTTMVNEALLVMRVSRFEFSGNDAHNNLKHTTSGIATGDDTFQYGHKQGKNIMHHMNPKTKNKLRYVCITRSTNTTLMKRSRKSRERDRGMILVNGMDMEDFDNDEHNEEEWEEESEASGEGSEEDDDDNDDYSLLYNPESAPVPGNLPSRKSSRSKLRHGSRRSRMLKALSKSKDETTPTNNNYNPFDTATVTGAGAGAGAGGDTTAIDDPKEEMRTDVLEEISSFPSLVCIAIHSDGSNPHVRQVLDLDQLVAIESVQGQHKGMVQLVFQNGVVVEIDCEGVPGHPSEEGEGGIKNNNNDTSTEGLNKNRFLWSLLQIHAILCTSVVDASRMNNTQTLALPQLSMRYVDRAELQYISTVNGFLSDNPVLCALLERQRNLALDAKSKDGGGPNGSLKARANRLGLKGDGEDGEEAKGDDDDDDMDGIAYDMIMGNFTRLTLFISEEEKLDAEDVLNNLQQERILNLTSNNSNAVLNANVKEGESTDTAKLDANAVNPSPNNNIEEFDANELSQVLQKQMRDLEAETCRRLIAWEDEKYYSASGNAPHPNPERRDTMEADGLANLFSTLDSLDRQLESMEEWLSDKAAAIKPLTDECRDAEEINRQMEQQQYSYELLSEELARLLYGLEVPNDIEDVLRNPKAQLTYHRDGRIDLQNSEAGVEKIYRAGKTLKVSFDKVQEEGGVHLRAIVQRVEGLLDLSNRFCEGVAQIVTGVMKRTVGEVGDKDGKDGNDGAKNPHAAAAQSLRNLQRQFQSSLLAFIKLIEVLALLKPSILPSVREKYAGLVAEGILSKKRLKTYFMLLPGKSSVVIEKYTIDLNDYPSATLRSAPTVGPNQQLKPVQAKDVEIALSELLPVIAREAYFTAALFGLSAKHLSGREKKRNFESAKRSVDFSSQYFKYYIARICGIASESDAEGKKVHADPMLSLIASILLNEAMDNYIDRQKKGGDHSLSLAYVRATILDLRKKVDKQWVSWIEEQIKWIETNPGVPLTGKRAGVFTSFARFPAYLDHVMICCKKGRPMNHVPNLSKIKVVTYYLQKLAAALFNSLHKCSERDSTDQQYAANVMRMENSYFFTQTIKQRGSELSELFQKQITAASSICKQSTDAYLGFMIKREFKALHTLFASISRIRREVGDADVPIHVPRSTFEKTLSKECNREILKEKIGSIYYRMEKHLSEAGGLLPVAWKALVKVLYEWFGRWQKVSSQCYKLTLEPSASDVVRIAKQAAGISAKKISDEKRKASSATSPL